jgi:hypothetical protein
MFHKGSGSRDALRVFVLASVAVGAISAIAGPDPAGKAASTAVAGTAFGSGVLIGTAPQIGPGIQAGKAAAAGPTVFTP